MPHSSVRAQTETGTDLVLRVEQESLSEADGCPRWNASRGELLLGGQLVKQFRQPAPNQRAILDAFEEEGWPERIDDPLPGKDGLNPRERLHDTIKLLNRNQDKVRIWFRGDGTGTGILWGVRKSNRPGSVGVRDNGENTDEVTPARASAPRAPLERPQQNQLICDELMVSEGVEEQGSRGLGGAARPAM